MRIAAHCSGKGCWNVYSGTLSDFSGSGYFGHGPATLGKVELYYQVSLNGGQSISKPVQFTATTGVASLEIEGDRLYYSKDHPEGKPVNDGNKFAFYTKRNISAHDTVQWLPNGYKAYEPTVQHGSVAHEWVWTMAEFPGNWYFYAKSVKFDKTQSSYRFGSSTYLGDDPVGSGYHSAD